MQKTKSTIITLHSVCNYGTQLQSYATQEKLKDFFSDVDFDNYRRPDTHGLGLIRSYSRKNPFRFLIFLPTYFRWKKVFGKFQRRYLNINHNIHNMPDAYFTGSDQIWNSEWNNGIIPRFYLGDLPANIPRFAFSSSFGKAKITKGEAAKIKIHLDKFRMLSAREKSGVNILKNQLGLKNADQIIDPTLLMPAAFWRQHSPSKPIIKEKYILVYNLKRSRNLNNYAKLLSKKTGYKLYRLCTRYDQILQPGKPILIPPILDFINLIDNAAYVVTDSFHATAFSINLHTSPICILPNKYHERITDFLSVLNISDKCIPKNNTDLQVLQARIDFTNTDNFLAKERQKANNYLREAAQCVHKHISNLPLISIIVPVYNAERHLKKCLDSIVSQTYNNTEVIIVNDGSTDGSQQICEKCTKKYPNVRLISQINMGVSSARNAGLKKAKGEWVTFIDADDWVSKDYCKVLAGHIDNDVDIIIARTIAKKNGKSLPDGYKGKSIDIFQTKHEKKQLLKSIFIDNPHLIKYPHISTCSAKLFRKSIIDTHKIRYDESIKYYEDAIFNKAFIGAANKVVLIDQAIYNYTLHKNSSTSKFNPEDIHEYEKIYKILRSPEYDSYFKIKNLNTLLIKIGNSKDAHTNKKEIITRCCTQPIYIKAAKEVDALQLTKRRLLLVLLIRLRLYSVIYYIYQLF